MAHTRKKKENIAIIGLGYVGLPLALLADKKGYPVVGIDTNTAKVDLLQKRIAPYTDEKVARELSRTKATFTTHIEDIHRSDIIAVCVPTPVTAGHMPDLSPIINAVKSIAPHMRKGQLILIESTVNPGVCESVLIPIIEKYSGLTVTKDFSLAHCPERINPGDPKWHVGNIPRVLGSTDAKGLRRAKDFYSSLITGEVKTMATLREAEAVKVVENSFRDINIAFVNELARSFDHLGIDTVSVIQGAATKPFGFLPHYPGAGVGGHCIPVDPYYLIHYAKENGFHHKFLSLARTINNDMPKYTVDLLEEAFDALGKPMDKSSVAVLGLAYKSDIDDDRESPAYEIIKDLTKCGVNVIKFDPNLPEKSDVKTLTAALRDADAVLIATAHTPFLKITPKLLKKHNVSILVDGRNCLDPQAFHKTEILYKGIGRNANILPQDAQGRHVRDLTSLPIKDTAALSPRTKAS